MSKISVVKSNTKGFTGGLQFSDPGVFFKKSPKAAKAYTDKCMEIAKADRAQVTEHVKAFYEAALDAAVEMAYDSGKKVAKPAFKNGKFARPERYTDRLQTARRKKIRISPSRAAIKHGAPGTLSVTTKPWATLGARYQVSAPVSNRYWNKTGRLWKQLQTALPKGRIAESTVNPTLVKKRIPRRKGDPGQLLFKYRVSLPRLPWPLNEMITESFVTRTERTVSNGPAVPWDFTRVAFVEGRRPMIAATSARLGEELYRALSKRTRIFTS